jgi:quercetin dioxygenase-like cupin family protein
LTVYITTAKLLKQLEQVPLPPEEVRLSLKIRRVVTGHDQNGRAIVTIDEIAKNAISRRPQHASCVIWSTGEFPADVSRDSDEGARDVATTDPNGTVFRLVEYGPGVAPRNHRTESIDYAIVMSGEIDMDLDGTNVHLKAGDVLVQRGTIHNWNNRGTEPCVVAFVLVAAKPVERGGKLLGATN